MLCMFFSFPLYAQNDFKNLDTETIDLIIDFGKTYLGRTYVYGGCNSSQGFDCSGFIHYIFKMGGFELPRSSAEIHKIGAKVDLAQLKKGDLLFFNTSNRAAISHVGIVSKIDTDQIVMLHVSSSKGVQEIDILKSDYWYARFIKAQSL